MLAIAASRQRIRGDTRKRLKRLTTTRANEYVKLYMAAEQGSKEYYDGVSKSWDEFEFDTVNGMTYKSMTGKSEHEREAAAVVLKVLVACKTATLDQAKLAPKMGANEADVAKFAAACDFLFTTLAMQTTGRAKQIVKECSQTRNGAEAWVRLRERFGRTTGATSYAEIFKFTWTSSRPFEDKWREWCDKVSRLPGGSLSDVAKEALAIEGVSAAHQTALEQHLRLRSPQGWAELTKSVDTYMSTMYASSEPTPMDIGAVTAATA